MKIKLSDNTLMDLREYIKENNDFVIKKYVEDCKIKNKEIEITGDVVSVFILESLKSDKEIMLGVQDFLKDLNDRLTNIITSESISKEDRENAYRLMEKGFDEITTIENGSSKRLNIFIYSAIGVLVFCGVVIGASKIVKLREEVKNTTTVTYKTGKGIKNILNGFR